ncbi:MAG: hypothetical protein ACRCSL_16840 [Microbacterium sp.]
MKRTILVVLFLVFGLAVVLSLALAPLGFSQSRPDARPLSPHIALAQLCVSEAGWDCFERGDGYAIHEVILRGARRQGLRYQTYARAYSQRLFGARPHDSARLAWVSQLDERGSAPQAWPRTHTRRVGDVVRVEPHAPWASFRGRWLAVLERAREVSTWTLDDIDEWGVCDGVVHDWGGWMDRDRAQRLGLIPVDCGVDEQGTRNDFYARPSLLEATNDLLVDRE